MRLFLCFFLIFFVALSGQLMGTPKPSYPYPEEVIQLAQKLRFKKVDAVQCHIKGCSKEFKSYSGIYQHWRGQHGEGYACQTCGSIFHSRAAKRSHENEMGHHTVAATQTVVTTQKNPMAIQNLLN